ncbi:MAG TPA: hypothetical protein PK216_14730 [Aquimonas sp.]|nr:hypothetical protein [Aquimonas sp.]
MIPSHRCQRLLLLILISAVGESACAATFQVGPGRAWTALQPLFDAVDLQPGDVVEVDGNVTYPGNVILRDADGGAVGNPVTIRGLRVNGQRPILLGGTNTIEFRLANHVVFEGFEVVGSVADNTFRCIYHHSHDVLIRDVLVRDCPRHGILGADQDSGSLTIEYSEIRNAGSGQFNHAIYMATDELTWPGSVFRLQHSIVRDSRFGDSGEGGNLIKSRAERNEIYYNWLEGAYYHTLELIGPDPAGGTPEGTAREDSDIVGNVIVHDGDFGAIFRFGGDGTGQSNGRYRFVNNTVLRRHSNNDTPTIFRLFDGIDAVEMHNNVFLRDGAASFRIVREVEAVWASGNSRVRGSHNWFDASSSFVPTDWTDNLTGTDPGFVNSSGNDFRPAIGSPLLNAAGTAATASGYEISHPHFPPAFHPNATPSDSPTTRPSAGALDIGAYERPVDGFLFANGFEG